MPLKSVTQFSNKEYYAARDALLEEETTSLQPTEGQPAPAPEVDPTLDAAPEVDGNFVRGLKGGVDNMQALGGGLKALSGTAVRGAGEFFESESLKNAGDRYVQEGMEYYQEQTAEAEQYKPDSTFQEIDSATDFGAWAAYTIGSVVPDLVGMVGTGGAGGLLAKSAVKQGVTEMAETLSKQATERLIKEGIEDQAAEKIARNMADKFAKDKIKKMTTRGATAGAFTYGTQQGASSTFARTLEETGEEAPLAAAVSGLTVGALNALPAFSALTKFLPKGKVDEAGEFISGVVNDKPAWVGEFVKDVTTQMGVESGTEALQLIVEEEIISFVNNNYTENESREYFDYISNERKRSSLIEASAAGFLFGGGTGVVGAGVKGATGGYNANANLGDDAKIVRTRSMNDPEFAGRIRQMYDEARTNAANGVRSIPLGDQSFLDDNPPLTNAERREAGLTELTNYDGTDIDIPDSGPDVDVPAVASVAVDQQNSEFGENTLPPSPQSPQADIVTDFPASTATGATKVRRGIRQFGHEHTFDAPMSLQAKPIQDQLIEIAVAANTPEALDPTNTDTVVEAIDMDDIERVFSRNQEFAIKLESGERADLPTIQEAYGDKSAEMETLTAGVMADLSANGLPKRFVDAVSGVFVHKQSQVTSPAITGNTTNGISINADLLGKALTDQDSLSELGWTLAHEVYHAADNDFNLSASDPSLDIRVDEMGEDPSVFMGEVMQEIFENWTRATDVGRRFDYPFNDLNDEILDPNKDNGEINRRYQKEVFAQLGAFFHSNPKQLKAEAPLAYNYIKGIRDKNLQTAQTVEAQDEVIQSTSPADTSQPEGISGQVRAPPESRVIESVQPATAGRDSETSTASEPADTGVARPQQDGTGQRERRDVQEREVTTEQPRTEVELKATNKKPTFKKADNWEDTGEQIITFDDGDRYTVYFDEDSAEAGEEQWYTSADGTFTGAEAMLGETKAETITALQEHRQKLLDAGEKSYNTPLNPQVGADTTFKAWDFISDKGQVTEKQLRAKFKRLEDNQFDNLVEGLLGETDPESVITLEDGKFLSYEYVQERDLDVLQSDLDDMDFIKKSDLSPMAQEITASDVLYGNESLDIVGTSRNGATVVVDLGRAFDDRVRKATGGRNLGDQTPENAAIVSDLIAHEAVQAMKTDGNAGEWYQEKVANAMSIAAKEFPELETDANAKFAFTSIMAITSNGASVPDNSVNTFEIYQEYRDSKVFPDFGVGVTSEAMKNAFALLNRLIEQNGIDSTRQFMDVDVTVKELKDSFGLAVSGELMGTELKGSAIIGPKIGGGFYQNLNGNFDPLTMDRWFMRTWGRLTGTLMADAERKLPVQMAKFREVALGDEYRSKLKKDGINRSQLTKDDEYAKAYGMKVQSAYANGGFKDKSAINKAANNFKNSQGEKQAPQNGKEREYIRSVMRMALDKVNETSGQAPVNMGALQAIIWYPEKDLYKQLGVGNAKSEPTDYETEFGKIVESRQGREQKLSGSVGTAQQSGSRGVQSGVQPDVQDSAQSSGRQAEQFDSIQDPEKRRKDRERAYKELRSARPSDSGSGGTETGIPRRFRRRAGKHSQILVAGQKVSGYKRELETGAKAALQLVNTYNGTVVELVKNKTNAQLFASKMQASKDASPYGAAVFVYPESEYQNMKMFMTEDGSAGIAIENGDTIVSLYSDGTNPNVTYSLASLAVEEGGLYSDAFDTQLPYIYQHVGFKVISRLKWDDSQAPSDWDKDTFKVFNNGKPDVVFMVVDPEYFGPYSRDEGYYVETYDEGLRSVRETRRPEQERISPKLKQAVQDRIDRNITATTLNEIFRQEGRYVKPMQPDMIAPLPDDAKYLNALTKTNREKAGTPSKETFWMADVLEDGVRYGSRLDIPSYNSNALSKDERVDVVTVHVSRPNAKAGSAGKRLGYYPTMRLRNGLFAVPEKGASKIALGADKNTIATIEGDYVQADHEQNRLDFIRFMDDPAWTQVSMNPERHSFYYDLESQTPVVSFSDAIQVGNLIIAKDVEYDDVDTFSFIKKKQVNKETGTLDDGSQSTNAFTYNDEIDGQADLSRRLKNRPIYKSLVDKYAQQEDFEAQAAEYLGVGRLPAELSPRDQENLSHGKVQNDLNDFHENFVDPLGDLIAELKADPDAIGTYLIAKHAAERNDVIAGKVRAQRDRNIARTEKQIESLLDDVESDHTVQLENLAVKLKGYKEDPLAFQDTGSGMTYDEAQSVLNLAEKEGTKADMERIASKVYEMLKHQREIMVSSGLMDADSVADWEATYQFYVPLKGFAAEPEGDTYKRTSKANGFSVVGSESMKAKGRKTLPVNPLFTAIEDVQMKIIRAQKNQTAQTFLDLLSKLGNSDSYTIYNNKFRPPKDSDHLTMQDLDQMARDTRTNGDPKYVQVKKGGQTFFIHFKSDTLNHALQDMSVAALDRNNTLMDKALTFATRFQTFRRNMLINYNPSWGLVNPIRDVQTGLMYALGEKDKKGSRVQGDNLIGKMAQSYLPSMRAMYRTLRGKPVINEMGKYAAEFMEDGASTGLMLVRDQAEQLRILKNKLKRGYTREALTAIGDWVEDFNSTMENAVRLAAYTEARKAGTDRQTAATLAKDLTVNFNRKGENTAQVNAGYLFFNAAVQGNLNIAQALGSDKGNFTAARGTAAGLVVLGTTMAVMNILSSEEDEDGEKNYADLPEHAKNRSLLFMYNDQEGFALPAPYGYNFFTNIGRLSAEMVFGINTPEESAQYLAENVLLNFVPISPSSGDNWEEMARGFYPDLLEVHLDMLANKNFFGSDIYIEQNSFMIERSNAYNSRRSTDKAFTSTAKFLNDATGGDKYEDGVLSFNPDKMQYVYEYFLGGVGRFVSQTGDVAARMMADEEFRKQDLPIIGTFYESPSEYEDRFEFYANWEESRKIEARLKEASTKEELVGLRQKYQSFIPVLDGGRNSPYKTANRDLRNISKTRKIVEAQDIPEERRREMLKKLLDNENKIFDLYNKMYRKAEKGVK